MDMRSSNMVSILNNDDNPSFAVRPSKSAKIRPTAYQHQQPRQWAPSSGNRHGTRGDQYMVSPVTSYPYNSEPPYSGLQGYPSNQMPPSQVAPQYPSLHHRKSSQYSLTNARLSNGNPTHSDRARGEPLSPESPMCARTGDLKAEPKVNKNKYPCPYALTHSCTATFTTSGHAARHGKKHTGEKGVHCPVCNKAFTRKDNMKQHRRTHRASTPEDVNMDRGEYRSRREPQSGPYRSHQQSGSLSHSDADEHMGLDMLNSPLEDRSDGASSMSTSYEYGGGPYAPLNSMPTHTSNGGSLRKSVSYSRSHSITGGLDALAIAASKSHSYGYR